MSAPFADRARQGFVQSFFETWKLALLEPTRFFRHVKVSETGSAVLFAVIAGTVSGWVSILVSFALLGQSMEALSGLFSSYMPPGMQEQLGALWRGSIVFSLILAPIRVLVWVFVMAGLHHLFLLLAGGADRGFDATLVSVCYASGAVVFSVVPGIGPFVFFVWYVVAAIIGLSEAQRCGTGKATFAGLAPGILGCCCIGALGAMFASSLGMVGQ